MEVSKPDFVLDLKPSVSNSIDSELMRVEKETKSGQEKWLVEISTSKDPLLSVKDLKKCIKTEEFSTLQERREEEPDRVFDSDQESQFTKLSMSEFPLVVVERLSFKDLKIYFEGVRNFSDFEEYLLQIKDEEKEISGGFSDQRKESSRSYTSSAINPGNLNKHSKKKDTKKLFLKRNQAKPLRCPECSFQCNKKAKFNYHLLTHTKIKLFKCLQCSYGSNHKNTLKRHMLLHTDIKLFYCVDCSYSCIERHKLRRHMLRHSQKKLFKCSGQNNSFRCSECKYETNVKGNLKIHMRKHNKEKLFKCSECEFESNYKSQMKIHMLNSHLKVKLFSCSECSFQSNYKIQMKLHVLQHSKVTLFKCADCNYGSNSKYQLKKHVLTHF